MADRLRATVWNGDPFCVSGAGGAGGMCESEGWGTVLPGGCNFCHITWGIWDAGYMSDVLQTVVTVNVHLIQWKHLMLNFVFTFLVTYCNLRGNRIKEVL
jgi:hypothetical protein